MLCCFPMRQSCCRIDSARTSYWEESPQASRDLSCSHLRDATSWRPLVESIGQYRTDSQSWQCSAVTIHGILCKLFPGQHPFETNAEGQSGAIMSRKLRVTWISYRCSSRETVIGLGGRRGLHQTWNIQYRVQRIAFQWARCKNPHMIYCRWMLWMYQHSHRMHAASFSETGTSKRGRNSWRTPNGRSQMPFQHHWSLPIDPTDSLARGLLPHAKDRVQDTRIKI